MFILTKDRKILQVEEVYFQGIPVYFINDENWVEQENVAQIITDAEACKMLEVYLNNYNC